MLEVTREANLLRNRLHGLALALLNDARAVRYSAYRLLCTTPPKPRAGGQRKTFVHSTSEGRHLHGLKLMGAVSWQIEASSLSINFESVSFCSPVAAASLALVLVARQELSNSFEASGGFVSLPLLWGSS